MIPQSSIDEWRAVAPWSTDLQVEQDLVVSRAVAELFADENMRELMAMRGGTVPQQILLQRWQPLFRRH